MRTGLVGALKGAQHAGAIHHGGRYVVAFGRALLDGLGGQAAGQGDFLVLLHSPIAVSFYVVAALFLTVPWLLKRVQR